MEQYYPFPIAIATTLVIQCGRVQAAMDTQALNDLAPGLEQICGQAYNNISCNTTAVSSTKSRFTL